MSHVSQEIMFSNSGSKVDSESWIKTLIFFFFLFVCELQNKIISEEEKQLIVLQGFIKHSIFQSS